MALSSQVRCEIEPALPKPTLRGVTMTQEVIRPAGTGPTTTPLSPGIKANGFIFVSGQTGRSPETRTVPEGMTAQTRQCLENMKAVLEAGGSSMDKVVKCTVFVTDVSLFSEMNAV